MTKIYTRVVVDMASNQIEEAEFFDYAGPIASCDPVTAAIGIGGSVVSGLVGGSASKSAANTQAGAANAATQAQLEMFNTINQQQAPWRQAGQNALATLFPGGTDGAPGSTLAPQFMKQFGPQDLTDNLAPNFAFMRDQGIGAVTNQLNAAGGLISGNTLKGVNDYAQNYAQNAYQQAFQNFTANQTNIFNRLSNIAGLGQTANQATGQAGATISGNAAQSMMNAGTAQAGGIVGQANALTGGMTNALGWYALPQIMNFGGGGGFSGAVAGAGAS